MDLPSFTETRYSCPSDCDCAREKAIESARTKIRRVSVFLIDLTMGGRACDDSPGTWFVVGHAAHHEPAIAERDRQIETTVRHGVEGKLAERVRMRVLAGGAVFDQDRHIGDRVQRIVARKNLSSNVDERDSVFLLEQEVEDQSIA